MRSLKELFMLDPEVIFLNHGSFGATPRPVFEAYQAWQRRLESQPVLFLDRELPDLLRDARQSLATYLNVQADELVYIPNLTFGVNVVARSLALGSGDEVLTTDHEYGACDNAWSYLSQRQGFSYREMAIAMPVPAPDEMVERFWEGVNLRTRVIFMSHITSPTATRFPVEEICRRARKAGIVSVIDGAHAPGQIPLNLTEIGADFYIGNAHKWLCAPKGSAFLYARFDEQSLIDPLVVGWGWGEGRSFSFGSNFLDYQQWLGTTDPAAYLSVPEAIQFQADHDWPEIRYQCHALARQAIEEISQITGLPSLYLDGDRYHQMATIALPPIEDLWGLKVALYDRFRIEIPVIEWNQRQFIRISVQAYNSAADIEALVAALAELLPPAR